MHLESNCGERLLMVGLEIGSSMPDAAIRKRIVGGLKLEVRGKNVTMHRDSHNEINWTDFLMPSISGATPL
jgi:hypothetical protein